jgi:ATP-binding cassette subfamily C protein
MEGLVTQETHLFHDSIRSNLKIAKLDATDEQIVAACKKASVHDFIMTLPQGYDTPVGELGDTLSGGERQRLGLARAFLHDAPLMLLDEPTSNLDSLNEAVILRSLRQERAGKTVVLVSHRKSTMRVADRVYSVEHGRMS